MSGLQATLKGVLSLWHDTITVKQVNYASRALCSPSFST